MSPQWSQERGFIGYLCGATAYGLPKCPHGFVSYPLANRAVLDQVRRLRGVPWTAKREARLLGAGEESEHIAQLQKALEVERKKRNRNTRLMSELIEELTLAQIQACRAISAEISERINRLEEELNGWAQRASHLPDPKKVHRDLCVTPTVLP
jgi:hypothetical protein